MAGLADVLKGMGGGNPNFKNAAWQYGYVAAIHARASTTLDANAAAGANSIETVAHILANSLVVVTLNSGKKTAPLLVQSSSGTTAPFTSVLSGPLLTSALVSGTAYTTLLVTAIPIPLPSGTVVTLTGTSSQVWTLSAPSVIGATSISVISQHANANYSAGAVLTVAGNPFQQGRQLPGAATSGNAVMTLPTIDCYLDGSQKVPASGQKTNARAFLTTGIRYLSGYTPVVGHTAVVFRGTGLRKSDRFAIGRLA